MSVISVSGLDARETCALQAFQRAPSARAQ
jgi:hypothetical protein